MKIRQFRYAPNHREGHVIPHLPTIQWLEAHEGLPSPNKRGGMRSRQERGTTAIRSWKTDEKRDGKLREKKENSAKLKPDYILYKF